MNSIFEKITLDFTKQCRVNKQEEERIENKIEMREKQVERLRKKAKRNWDTKPHWLSELLRPVINELKKRMPEIKDWDDDKLTPMGLRAAVSVFPKYKGLTLMIVFVPRDISKGWINMGTGEKKGRSYPESSIAAMNNLDNVTVPIESIDQIVQHLKAQIKRGSNG